MSNPTIGDVLNRLEGVKTAGEGWQAKCPCHDDGVASLSVTEGEKQAVVVHCHAGCDQKALLEALGMRGEPRKGNGKGGRLVATYDYLDADGKLLFQVCRFEPKDFRQRRPNGAGGWVWKLGKLERVLYHLPEVLRAVEDGVRVHVVEGEKDADNLRRLGLVATTSPMGAGKWRKQYTDALAGARVVLMPDKDGPGREHMRQVAEVVGAGAASVHVIEIPGPGKDVSDWIGQGGTREALEGLVEGAAEYVSACSLDAHIAAMQAVSRHLKESNEQKAEQPGTQPGVSHNQELADMLVERYVYVVNLDKFLVRKTGDLIEQAALNKKHFVRRQEGERMPAAASTLMLSHSGRVVVDGLTWEPGREEVIERQERALFNLYRPTKLRPKQGDVTPWLEHGEYLIPNLMERNHLLDYMAFNVQHPGVKVNHHPLLGGGHGIGKDTLIHPFIEAVGAHNTGILDGSELNSSFTEYRYQRKLLVVQEIQTFHKREVENQLKPMCATPPYELSINIKGVRRFSVPNILSLVFMSNHKTQAMRVSRGDRRLFCIWSPAVACSEEYYAELWEWLEGDGVAYVHDWLIRRDVSGFNPKGRAPWTEYKALLQDVAEDSELEENIVERIEEKLPPFEQDMFRWDDLKATYPQCLYDAKLKEVLESLGVKKLVRDYRREGGRGRVRVWVCRDVERYQAMAGRDLAQQRTLQLRRLL